MTNRELEELEYSFCLFNEDVLVNGVKKNVYIEDAYTDEWDPDLVVSDDMCVIYDPFDDYPGIGIVECRIDNEFYVVLVKTTGGVYVKDKYDNEKYIGLLFFGDDEPAWPIQLAEILEKKYDQAVA